ncbi:MAG: hypothetical protein AAFP69_03445 [Planctomycetota bacterium]
MKPDTGNGATIAFLNSGFTARIINIGELEQTLGKIDSSHLGTTGDKTYIPEDLGEPGEIAIEFQFDAKQTPPPRGVAETVVVTFPTNSDESSPASYTASGFLTKRVMPSFVNNQINMGKTTFALDNAEVPFAFTPAVAAA